MADPTTIDHQDASALLTRRFQQTYLVALLKAWLRSLNAADEALVQMYAGLYDADVAVGVQLQTLARLVGAARVLGNDAFQRILVQTETLVRKSSGNTAELLEILDTLYNDEPALEALYPAALLAGPVYSTSEALADLIGQILRRATAAGVRIDLIFSEKAETDTFAFAVGDAVEVDAERGWGDDTDPLAGGVFAGAVSP
jgi:hypothetical protein